MIRRQSSYFEFKISQTLVFLDFVIPVLEIDTYCSLLVFYHEYNIIMNRNSLLAEEPLKEKNLWMFKNLWTRAFPGPFPFDQ